MAGGSTRDALERATALYRGDLLESITAPDPAFEEWLTPERQRLRDLAMACLDRLLVLEDDAERAVRTGIAIVTAITRLHVVPAGALACRIGIATGLVVASASADRTDEPGIVGEAPHLAARLQAAAPPGGVLICASTRRLLGELFELESLSTRHVSGLDAPVPAWRVVSDGLAESRFEALRGSDLLPLIGRRAELTLLLDRWQRALGGAGQVVQLAGTPGIGKSRLVRALRERLVAQPHTSLSLFCSPHHTGSALYPVARFAGAASCLEGALIVNPYDVGGVAAAMHQALTMPLPERQERHRRLLDSVRANDIHAWRERCLMALSCEGAS